MNFMITSIIGLLAGIMASMGLGGGFILVIYFAVFTDTVQKSAQGINLLFFIPVTIVAVAVYIKNKMIDLKMTLLCALFGVAAAIGGFYVAQAVSNEWLRKIFACFIIGAGLKDLIFSRKKGL